MLGSTLTMPTLFDTSSALPRAHSSSNIPNLVTLEFQQPQQRRDDDGLPRPASFSCLPALDSPRYSKENPSLKVIAAIPSSNPPIDTQRRVDEHKGKSLVKDDSPKQERLGRRKSLVARPKSWIQRVRGSPERSGTVDSNHLSSDVPPVPSIPKVAKDGRPKPDSFATFARKTWISTSRSPSPRRDVGKDTQSAAHMEENQRSGRLLSFASPRKHSTSPQKHKQSSEAMPSESPAGLPLQRRSTLSKLRQRPQSVLMNLTSRNSANSSASSLQGSSIDNRSTPRTSTDKVPPVPKQNSSGKLHQYHDYPRRRDELWSAFRSLENDLSKFQTKSWSLKANIVRSSLLPFLHNHANHPSSRTLRPEDLDRRIIVLNKWWSALIAVLDGSQNQTVSGVDRPVLLDACYLIMVRPEWRLPPSQFAPLAERTCQAVPPIARQKSSASLNSSANQFMTESVYHNARNLFIQNLLAQMSFVVDKISLRNAPASLVTFCGKAAAYAFFFVPGVAEILVRVWRLQSDMLRRVADEFELPRQTPGDEEDLVLPNFPTFVQTLGWKSLRSMTSQLRRNPVLPVAVSKIPWFGPWSARWCGRDSDLFFVFVKHYHILAQDFLPPELPFRQRARLPGFVLVHAQILTVLDSTMHRPIPGDTISTTFDDVLSGVDATAAALPLPATNSARSMAENRLIMLLRDFISERPSGFQLARVTFAEAFSMTVQATARKTSLFDHNACFLLCDFLEEALALYMSFHLAHSFESDFIDWRFWLQVCKKMLESQNTMSEIRIFAFIFGAWSSITNVERRKEIMCFDWLLTEDTFEKFFNHWCPMVRSYYMRLICWRLCREVGDVNDLDRKIYLTVSARLQTAFTQHVSLTLSASKSRRLPPSTAPCLPAPGRRLLIMRHESQPPSANFFLGFDGLSSNTTPSNPTNAYKRHSALASLSHLDTADSSHPKLTADSSPNTATRVLKRWSMVSKLLPSSPFSLSLSLSPSISLDPSQSTSSQSSTSTLTAIKPHTLEAARLATALARSRPTRPPLHTKSSSTDSETPPATGTHMTYCFRFSLEWAPHFEKLPASVPRGGVGRKDGPGSNIGPERRLGRPRLPSAAQGFVDVMEQAEKEDGIEVEIRIGRKCSPDRTITAKYAGRALAEWAGVVSECNGFGERRLAEGVPGLRYVEVPSLGVEGFRRIGG